MFQYWQLNKARKYGLCLSFPLLLLFHIIASAQKPVLQFQSDSVSLGEPVEVLLFYKHPPDQELIFPDSNFNYSPFEFVSKRYYPTATYDSISLDSVVYTLRTFADTNTYTIALPLTLFKGKDTLRLYSNADSIEFRPFIAFSSDSLKLISNTQFLPLEKRFNYLILAIGFGVLFLLAALVYVLFGNSVFRQIKKYRMKLAHASFMRSYDSLIGTSEFSVKRIEEALTLWKRYITSLDDKPYTTYTSAEIAFHLKREEVKKNLQNIDSAIYGGRKLSAAAEDFALLKKIAIELYQRNMNLRQHEAADRQ